MAIDTATDHIGLSLDDGATVLAERIWPTRRHHTAELAPEVALVLRRCGVGPADLEGVAVAQGPGSYTGLRIGMALAKGLALAHGLHLVGVPTLDIVAMDQKPRGEPMLAVIEAGRGRVAAVWYKWDRQAWIAQSEAIALTWDELLSSLSEPTFLCGEVGGARKDLGRDRRVILARPTDCVRRPSFLAELARARLRQGEPEEPAALAPTYLGDIEGGAA